MDAMEIEIKLRLAELQKRYHEKRLLLDRLQTNASVRK